MLQRFIYNGNDVLEQLVRLGCKGSFFDEIEAKHFVDELEAVTAKVRESWTFAVCSEAGESALERYFSYQLTQLSGLLSTASGPAVAVSAFQLDTQCQFQCSVCGLMDFAAAYFDKYLRLPVPVCTVYKSHFIDTLSDDARLLTTVLDNSGLADEIKNCLIGYLEAMTGEMDVSHNLRQLHYFRSFVRELLPASGIKDNDKFCDFVKDRLFDLEFNHFRIFVYMQDTIRAAYSGKTKNKRKAIMDRELNFLVFKANGDLIRYDDRWPALSAMLTEWLKGELDQHVQKTIEIRHATSYLAKLRLELPVSHLAFLIRLLSKENIFGLFPLTEIFNFFSANFSTKRQETLSPGGLSKEYYSKNMVTAVEVRALLLKMIARINHDYFPVWVAISVVIFYPSGI
jgi:hypothetical protein